MDDNEAMIVAGIGFRRSAAADEIVALVELALERAALKPDALRRLATVETLASMPAFTEAARRLAVPAIKVGEPALADAAPQVRTMSARSLSAYGIGSVAEAAALAGAGPGASLILERINSPSVTCALAQYITKPETAQ
jgi:cobalt-precorrin 5A hydrolase